MNRKSFAIRRFTRSDVEDVIQLLKLVFGSNFSVEWWNWKYKSNPAGFWGETGDIWIAESMNQVVGHFAVIPEKIKLGSETVTAAQIVDAATHPEYRGLGIFKTLVKRVCLETQNRYSFLFGFPNETIYKSYLKLGWRSFGVVEFLKFLNYDRPLRSFFTNHFFAWSGKMALRALRAARYVSPNLLLRKHAGDPVEIKKVEQFPNEMDDFWKLVRSEYETILERTTTFLNWRFSRCFGSYQKYVAQSVENGSIVGYLVLKKTEMRNVQNVLAITDLHALPGENRCISSLIELAIRNGKSNGLDLIHCRIPPWHGYAKILYTLGFISVGRTLQRLKIYKPTYLVFYNFREKKTVPKQQGWFYTLNDTDDA